MAAGWWVVGVSAAVGCGIVWRCFAKTDVGIDILCSDKDTSWRLESVIKPYRVPRLLQNASVMLFFGSLSKTPLDPSSSFIRQIISLKDGGSIAVDWFSSHAKIEKKEDHKPILIAFHGITGHGKTNYMKFLCKVASEHALKVVCVNARGTGDSVLTSQRGFHAGKSDDVHEVIDQIHNQYPDAPLFAIGYSLGANYLGKYLGEHPDTVLTSAALLSNPFDLKASNQHLSTSKLGRFIDFKIAENLKNWIRPHSILFDVVNKERIENIRTIREFDEEYILPVFKEFVSVDDYYRKCSSAIFLNQVSIPLLIMHSLDDNVCPVSSLPTLEKEFPPNIVTCLTDSGSHVCWLDSLNIWDRHSWAESVALSFLCSHLQESTAIVKQNKAQ